MNDKFPVVYPKPTLCSSCEKIKENVEFCIDPYIADVGNEEVWVWLCPECYQEACNDI